MLSDYIHCSCMSQSLQLFIHEMVISDCYIPYSVCLIPVMSY
jgi:hypothetical protein